MMKFPKNYLLNLYAIDLLIISFASFLTLLNIVFFNRVDNWINHVFFNTLFTIFIVFIAQKDSAVKSRFWQEFHYWYILPTIFISFKEIYFMVKPIAGVDSDHYLIAIDKFIFGINPTQFLFLYSNPVLTEILQIAYSTFFFLPIILIVELQLKKKILNFRFAAFSITLGFVLSYIGYFLVPAIGPRFTLHNFEITNFELPGIWLTNHLREIINTAEAVPKGTLNPTEVVQRDVFPSGHTQMTLIVMYLSYKFKTKFRYFIYPTGILLIFATVYLRYHYVIDVIAGFIFMIATMVLAKYLFNAWNKYRNCEIFDYNNNI